MNQNYQQNGRHPKKDSNDLWVLAIIFGFIFSWPIGLTLLILKINYDKRLKNQAEQQEQQEQQAQDGSYSYRYENGKPISTAGYRKTDDFQQNAKAKADDGAKTSYASPKKAAAKKEKKKRSTWGYNLAAAISAFAGLATFVDVFTGVISWGFEGYMFEDLFYSAMFLVAGLILFWLGAAIRRRERNFARYSHIIGNRAEVPLEAIASVTSKSTHLVAKELQALIDRDYFGKKAYIDYGKMQLILDSDAVELRQPAPESTPVAETPDLPDTERERILKEIRQMDILIADEVVSQKIVRIEELTDKILSLVESKPEKKPQIRSFMNYYLPTTLKLLKAYSEFESQGVEGDTIAKAKGSIEEILDNLIAAFESQLDQLFSSEAMDISSDIQVLENMMRRDGFSDDGMKMTRM